MFPLFDAFLALPAVVIMLCVVMFWGTVAISVHRVIVPYLCGADGKKLVKFEAEVTSQIAVAFGLLLSFNAVWVWDRGDRVNHAVVDEALALATALDDSESMLTAEQSQQTRLAVGNYAHFLVEQEWPTLNDAHAVRIRPAELIALRKCARVTGDADLIDAVDAAETAREVRIRDGLAYMSPPRWIVVILLAILLLISIGALHGDAPRGRKLALTLVALAVSFCFCVLLLHARPFVGQFAIRPTELQAIIARLDTMNTTAAQ